MGKVKKDPAEAVFDEAGAGGEDLTEELYEVGIMKIILSRNASGEEVVQTEISAGLESETPPSYFDALAMHTLAGKSLSVIYNQPPS